MSPRIEDLMTELQNRLVLLSDPQLEAAEWERVDRVLIQLSDAVDSENPAAISLGLDLLSPPRGVLRVAPSFIGTLGFVTSPPPLESIPDGVKEHLDHLIEGVDQHRIALQNERAEDLHS